MDSLTFTVVGVVALYSIDSLLPGMAAPEEFTMSTCVTWVLTETVIFCESYVSVSFISDTDTLAFVTVFVPVTVNVALLSEPIEG